MTTNHTPAPKWSREAHNIYALHNGMRYAVVTVSVGTAFGNVAEIGDEIVKACNAHDANVARIAELEAALTGIMARNPSLLSQINDGTDEGAELVKTIRAALAKVPS